MQFITTLAGHNFRSAEDRAALSEIRDHNFPHKLRIERDPDNAYDPNAVRVIAVFGDTEFFIGFVEAAVAKDLAHWLDAAPAGNGFLWAEGHTPEVTRVEIIDWASGPKKPTIVIELTDGHELGTLVKQRENDDDEDEGDDFTNAIEGEAD